MNFDNGRPLHSEKVDANFEFVTIVETVSNVFALLTSYPETITRLR